MAHNAKSVLGVTSCAVENIRAEVAG